MSSNNILLVEDETHLAIGLKLNLEFEGFIVDIAETARQAKQLLTGGHHYQAIILDISLPDDNGFEVCQYIRDQKDYTPVLMLTARSLAEDRVHGLEVGADDYLTKPFDLDELLARLRSMLRRQQWNQQQTHQLSSFRFGQANINFDRHEATMNGKKVRITSLELDLLRYFIQNSGRVISRQELLSQVWKLTNYPQTRTVDNFVMRLRRQFEPDPTKPIFFLSIRGAGYKFIDSQSKMTKQ